MRYILTILLVGCAFIGFSQSKSFKAKYNDNSINFYDVCEEADAYFATIDITKKGSGWKGYQRWRALNEYKYYPSGDRTNIDPYFVQKQYQAFLDGSALARPLFSNGWNDLGPYSIDSITGHYAAGIGRVEDFYVDPTNPNIIYQGSRSGGFWKSNDGGATWQGGITDTLFASGVNTIAVSPTNSDSILINVRNAQNGMSHGIYRSVDGGDTWVESGFNPVTVGYGGLGSDFQIYEIAYHPRVPNLVFVGTDEGLFRSTDNLATWTHLITTSNVSQIDFHPTNDNIIYLYDNYYWGINHDVVLRSTDMGNVFSQSNVLAGNGGNRSVRLSTNPVCPNCLWVASDNGVWKSTDDGQNFTFLANPPQGCGGFSVSDTSEDYMVYGYVDLELSVNAGDTFNRVTRWSLGNTDGAGSGHHLSYINSTNYVHADLRIARCINGVFYVGTDGFLSKSMDNGISWTNIGEGVGIRENYKLGVSQSNHYRTISGSQDNGTSIKMAFGWNEFYGADGMEGLIHPLNDDWIIGSLQSGGRRRTLDGGLSQSGVTPSGSTGADWIAPLAYDPNDHFTIYDFRDSVYKSEDFASNYEIVGAPTTFTGNIHKAAIAENNSDIILISKWEYIEKSIDGGSTFFDIKGTLPNESIQDIAFDPNDDNTFIVVYGSYQADNNKVYLTDDGGSTWSNITHNLGSMPIRSVVIDHTNQSNIYLGAEIGVYTMPVGSTNWTLYNPNLPNVSSRELEIVYGSNTLRSATWGRGLWEYHLVGRQNHPAIVHTSTTSRATLNTPKEGVDQYVTSRISYAGALTSVYTKWSVGSPIFNNTITMSNVSDSTWVTDLPLTGIPDSTKVYFKVFAVGSTGDTTETYKFMYEVRAAEYCEATGNASSGNLYLDSVSIASFSNTSLNSGYALYNSPVVELFIDSTYKLSTSANTGWSSNNHFAWIDFNNDLEFDDTEMVLNSPDSGHNAAAFFTVPNTASLGDTVTVRMRLSYWGSTGFPCGDYFGEVEDYKAVIKQECAPINDVDVVTSCDNHQWIDGITYSTDNNTATHTLTSTMGCDSIVTLDLTIINSTGSTDVKSACDNYTWINGITYTATNNSATHTLTNNVGCDSVVSLNLTINTVNATVAQSGVVLTASPTAATSYQWVDCNNGYSYLSGEINSTLMPTTNGSYAAIITNAGCSDTSNCVSVNLTGLNSVVQGNALIYPNPSSGSFVIQFADEIETHNITIYDAKGAIVKSIDKVQQSKLEVDLDVAAGKYFVFIDSNKGLQIQTVIIE